MTKKIIISESEKSRILKMYGVLNEQTKSSIVGVVMSKVTKGFPSTQINSPIPDVEVVLNYMKDIEVKELQRTTTDENGEFIFKDVNVVEGSSITILGKGLFYDKTIDLEDIKEGDNDLGDIFISPKKITTELPPTPTTSKEKPCTGYKSTKTIFYGFGVAKNKPFDVLNIDETESIQMAKRHAVKQYLLIYPSDVVTINEILKEFIKYEIVCTYTSSDLLNPMTTNVVEIGKETIDLVIQKILSDRNIPDTKEKIKFEDYDFAEAVDVSYMRNGEKIFLLFGIKDQEETQNVINYIENNQEMTKKINSDYIPLFYEVDRSDIDRYMAASEPLGIRTYPSIVILKGINDPNKTYVKDSIETIGYEDRVADNLSSIDNLIK